MDHSTHSRAPRIGAACLLAVFALLVARAHWASAGGAGEASANDAATCGGSRMNPVEAMQIAVDEAMEQTRRDQATAAADPSGWVVLNNRGYNYGPPNPIRLDPELFLAAEPTPAQH